MSQTALALAAPTPSLAHRAGARAQCHAVLAKGSKSFAVAARLLSPGARTDAAVLYTFCRRVDDAIDLCSPESQPAALAELRARLDSVYALEAQPDVPWQAFSELVHATAMPRLYPEELLRGMQMDVDGTRYETLDDLLLYCHRVAGVVGLMLCHVFGVSRDGALRNAAHLGIAMQLTNICRDVAEDWERGRLYVPRSELRRAGAESLSDALGGPLPRGAAEPLARSVQSLLTTADQYYRSADRGLSALPYRASLAVRAARHVYAAIGGRLRARHFDVLSGRAFVPNTQKLGIVVYSALASLQDLPRRWWRPARFTAPGRVARYPEDVLP